MKFYCSRCWRNPCECKVWLTGLVTNHEPVTREQKRAAVEDQIRNFEAYTHTKLTPEIEASLRKWAER